MKELYLDSHSGQCACSTHKDDWFAQFCLHNPERFLFFLGTDFYIVTYHSCLDYGDHLSFKKELIESGIEHSKIFELWEVQRSVNFTEDLREYRLRNTPFKKYIKQVNYIYYSNSHKAYAITTTTKYMDALCDQTEIDKNYNSAVEFIQKKGEKYAHLLKQLDQLYLSNRVFIDTDEIQISKSIDHLITSINQLTK